MSSGSNIPSFTPRVRSAVPPAIPTRPPRINGSNPGAASTTSALANIAASRRGGTPPPVPKRGPFSPTLVRPNANGAAGVTNANESVHGPAGNPAPAEPAAAGTPRVFTRAQVGTVQPEGRMNIGGHRTNLAAAATVQENLQANPQPPTVRMTIPGIEGQRDVSLAMVPAAMRSQPDIAQQLQAKIQRGGEAFRNVSSGAIPEHLKPGFTGNFTPEMQREKAEMISDMTFFLQAHGEAKVGPFSQGAYSLPDPHGNVEKFLTSYPHSYQRASSHISSIQDSNRSNDKLNPGTEHYGLDLNDDGQHMDTALPNGMKTILFGKIPASSLAPGGQSGISDRLFFKMETHGTGGGGVDEVLHNPPGQVRGRMQKLTDLLGHGKGLIKSLYNRAFGDNSPVGTFKERIPNSIKNEYKELIALAGRDRDIADALKKNNPNSTSGGVRVMLRNIDFVEEAMNANLNRNSQLQEAFTAFKARFAEDPAYDHPAVRIGQEVILTEGEMGQLTLLPKEPRPFGDGYTLAVREGVNQSTLKGMQDTNMLSSGEVAFSNPNRLHTEQNMNTYFARDFVRYDFTIDTAGGPMLGRDFKTDGGALTEAGYDRVKEFFHSQYPGDPAAGDRAMRVVTGMANQNNFNRLFTSMMSADPDSALHAGGRDLFRFPTSPHANSSFRLSANSDGTFTLRMTHAKLPMEEMGEPNKFWLGGSEDNDKVLLDPKDSDFRIDYEFLIDPRNPDLQSQEPRVEIASISGYERLISTDGTLIYQH